MHKYGAFDKDGKFIITDPRTPEPWLHYLIRPGQAGTETFCSGVTYTGGGFDVRGTHENTFVDTMLHLNDEDDMGRYIYIMDREENDLFTTSWQPLRRDDQGLTTTFEFGKISFETEHRGIRVKQQMFVPGEFDGWIQMVEIENTSLRQRVLEVYPFVPIHMGNALERLLAGDNDGFFGGCAFDKELAGIVFRRNQGIPVNDDSKAISGMLGNVAVFYSSLNTAETEYETNMEGLFGDRFHNQCNPGAILKGKLSSKDTAYLRRACGVFKNELILDAGEKREFAVALIAGSTRDYYLNHKDQLRRYISLVDDPAWRTKSLHKVESWWKEIMDRLKIESPDPKLNNSFRWLQYQCEIVYVLNRMKSRYHTGYEYGWGFRDILQDILYTLPYRNEESVDMFKFISSQMFSTGKAYHNFFIDQPGNSSIEASDDPLWFVEALAAFVKETGNFSLLDEITDYAEVREGTGEYRGSILEHAERCIESVWNARSERGLPFMKDCDWNDDLNEGRKDGTPNERMESVMVAQQLYHALLEMADLLSASGRKAGMIEEYRRRAAELKDAVMKYSLDSAGYFKRALSLEPGRSDTGSSESRAARIFLEPQTFGINCGIADGEMADQLLDTVEEYLDTDYGAMLCFPVFTDLAEKNVLPEYSWGIEKEPPAMKENGGIFMHLNAWLVQSYCMAGRGRDALKHYMKTIPENMSSDQDRYMSEPYVYPEYVRGRGIDSHGRGGHTWLTGTAPTMHASLTQYIFGVRAEYGGLRIDPCVDPEWREFSMERRFRGDTYLIRFQNPDAVESGVASIQLDGQAVSGNLLPPKGDGKIHEVTVIMGITP